MAWKEQQRTFFMAILSLLLQPFLVDMKKKNYTAARSRILEKFVQAHTKARGEGGGEVGVSSDRYLESFPAFAKKKVRLQWRGGGERVTRTLRKKKEEDGDLFLLWWPWLG